MNKTKHTPTPWRFDNPFGKRPVWEHIVTGPVNCPIYIAIVSQAMGDSLERKTQAQCKANTAFIVEAVNSHDKLRRDRDALLAVANTYLNKGRTNLTIDDYRSARDVVAAAESEE